MSLIARRRQLFPLAALAGLLGLFYGIQGTSRLPLTGRLLILLSVILALFFGLSAVSLMLGAGPRYRRERTGAGVLLLVFFLVFLPLRVNHVLRQRPPLRQQSLLYGELPVLLRSPDVDALLSRCSSLSTPGDLEVPYVAYLLRPVPGSLYLLTTSPPDHGAVILPSRTGPYTDVSLTGDGVAHALRRYRLVAHDDAWTVYERGCQ